MHIEAGDSLQKGVADSARQRRRFARFLVAGGINTLFGFALYSVAILAELPAWLALLLSTIAAIVFNFLTTGGYVFRDLSPHRFPRFVLSYAIGYFVNLGALEMLSLWITDRILAQAILILPLALLSYALLQKLVFLRTSTL